MILIMSGCGLTPIRKRYLTDYRLMRKEWSKSPPNQAVQRTGASRFAQRQIGHQRRLAPVADLVVRQTNPPYDNKNHNTRIYIRDSDGMLNSHGTCSRKQQGFRTAHKVDPAGHYHRSEER